MLPLITLGEGWPSFKMIFTVACLLFFSPVKANGAGDYQLDLGKNIPPQVLVAKSKQSTRSMNVVVNLQK